MGNFLFFFTALIVAFFSIAKPSSEPSVAAGRDGQDSLEKKLAEMEDIMVKLQRDNRDLAARLTQIETNLKAEFTSLQINQNLTRHMMVTLIAAHEENKFFWETTTTSLVSLRQHVDGSMKNFQDRENRNDSEASKMQNTRSVTNERLSDIQRYFDSTFSVVASHLLQFIHCRSDMNSDKIRFSRAVDTGTGGCLPINAELSIFEKTGQFSMIHSARREQFGAFRCGYEAELGSVHTVVPFQQYNLSFSDPSRVASVGDSVRLRLNSTLPRRVLWSRDGRRVRSWDGRTEVDIYDLKSEDAGVYSARYEGESEDTAVGLVSVRRCKANFYGERCDEVCPPCYNGGICHDLLGMCLCPQGFIGSNCETPCPEGYRGADCSQSCGIKICRYRMFCHPDPYGCYCASGFRGPYCSYSCEPGWYGAHCRQPCHCANGPKSCNRFTGECSGGCATGWKGLSCQIRDDEEMGG